MLPSDETNARRPDRPGPILSIALGSLGFRLLSAILAFFATLAFPVDQPSELNLFGRPSPFLDSFTRYDAAWYYQIARYGYRFVTGGPPVGEGKAGKVAYFPLYPLLMGYVGRLFGTTAADLFLGGLIVSWISFVLAMVGVFCLARLDLPRDRAERAALLTAIFPFSFFFGMVYTEALFLLCAVLAFYAFRTRRWLVGGIAGGLATATRPTGILILPSLAWIAWRSRGSARSDRASALVGLLLVAGGVGAYSFYVYRLTGHPFEWAASITRWGYHPGGSPWAAPLQLGRRLLTHPYQYLTTDRMALYDTLYGVTALAFVFATPFVWRRFGPGYGLFMLLNLYVPLSSGVFEGLGRYCSILFPCFIWLAAIRSPFVSTAVVVAFALFYMLGLALFVTIHPLY